LVTVRINNTIDKITSNDIFTSVKHKILLSRKHHWHSIPATNKLKSIKSSTKQSYTLPDLSQRKVISITRKRIGHAFNTHSFLISKDYSLICNTCQTRITVQHILEECSIYKPTRTSLHLPYNIKEILNEEHTLNTIKFITKCNLIDKL